MVRKRKQNQQFRDVVEEWRKQQNDVIKEPKCLSDQVFLYIRYIFWNLKKDYSHRHPTYVSARYKTLDFNSNTNKYEVVNHEPEPNPFLEAEVKAIYYLKQLRGSEYVGNHSPKSIAAGLVYIGCVMEGVNVTQKEVAATIDTHDGAIRKHYTIIKNELKL